MTFSDQLFNKLYYFKTFLGVFSRDNLPKITSFPCSLIMNTDPENKPGQHWVAIYINENEFGTYFDSYGYAPLNREFEIFLNNYCKSWTFNPIMLQGFNSYTCGEFCVLFVLLMSMGFGLLDIIHLFSTDFKTNDKIVKEIFKNL